jgi:hypothetical protein
LSFGAQETAADHQKSLHLLGLDRSGDRHNILRNWIGDIHLRTASYLIKTANTPEPFAGTAFSLEIIFCFLLLPFYFASFFTSFPCA